MGVGSDVRTRPRLEETTADGSGFLIERNRLRESTSSARQCSRCNMLTRAILRSITSTRPESMSKTPIPIRMIVYK